jgi:hypothetical protein
LRGSWLFVLIALHTPAGQAVLVNPDLITSLHGRSADRPELFVENAHCLVNKVDGKFITVRENCNQVRRLIEEKRTP